jgi:cation:H+ antiporter
MSVDPNYNSFVISWLALICGLVMLTSGGEFLVSGAAKLAKRWGMSSLLIGLTVVAFGTSMPELFVGLIALFQGYPDILTGNVVGSNIANVGLVLGISALITPLPVRFKSIDLELYILLAASLALIIVAWHGTFPRLVGIIFITGLILYTVISFRQAINKNKARQDKEPAVDSSQRVFSTSVIAGLIIGGFILLGIGSDLFINGAVDIARHFGISELVIGLTLAAIGTSLPELASCLAAIRQRQTGILTGNVIGSNLFNILMVLGFCGLLKPFSLSSQLLTRDIPIMFSFSAVLLPILAVQQELKRHHGLILLLAYAAYLFILR